MMEFDRLVGLKRIRAFHLNDSRQALGSRVDRHQHVGRGAIGLAGFGSSCVTGTSAGAHVLGDAQGRGRRRDLDVVNLQVLANWFDANFIGWHRATLPRSRTSPGCAKGIRYHGCSSCAGDIRKAGPTAAASADAIGYLVSATKEGPAEQVTHSSASDRVHYSN